MGKLKEDILLFTSLRPLTDVSGSMPRTARASVGDICYHVINRNAQTEVFHKDGDYRAFVELIRSACERIPMRVLAYCVMPNHFRFRSKLPIPTRKGVTFSLNYNSLTPNFSRVFSKRNISWHTAFHVFITSNN